VLTYQAHYFLMPYLIYRQKMGFSWV